MDSQCSFISWWKVSEVMSKKKNLLLPFQVCGGWPTIRMAWFMIAWRRDIWLMGAFSDCISQLVASLRSSLALHNQQSIAWSPQGSENDTSKKKSLYQIFYTIVSILSLKVAHFCCYGRSPSKKKKEKLLYGLGHKDFGHPVNGKCLKIDITVPKISYNLMTFFGFPKQSTNSAKIIFYQNKNFPLNRKSIFGNDVSF